MTAETRAPRKLVVEPGLAGVLCNQCTTAQIDLGKLGPIEGTIGFRFADDILASFAAFHVSSAHVPSVDGATAGQPSPVSPLGELRFALGEVIGHTGRLREWGARGDLIGVAVDDEVVWAIDKRLAVAGSTSLVSVTRAIGAPIVGTPTPLLEFLKQTGARTDPGENRSFEAVLYRPTAISDAPGRKVSHPTFGIGVAFTESGNGPTRKVKCDFPRVGLKVIQARFLTFHD